MTALIQRKTDEITNLIKERRELVKKELNMLAYDELRKNHAELIEGIPDKILKAFTRSIFEELIANAGDVKLFEYLDEPGYFKESLVFTQAISLRSLAKAFKLENNN